MLKLKRIIQATIVVSIFIASLQAALAQNDVVNDAISSNYNLNKPRREQWLTNTAAGLFIHFSFDSQLGVVISHSLVGASDDYVSRYFDQLPKTFDPDKFDPYKIATLAKLAGMKYIVFTTKHHSGFCMWDTKTTDFNITKTPYKKDLLKQFVEATRAAGLEVGFYFSPEDFHFLYEHHLPISRTDVVLSDLQKKQYDEYTKHQCEELMTNYGKIDVLFIDGEPKELVKKICWQLQPNLLITRGAISTPEQTLPGTKIKSPWLSPVTIGTAWQYQPTNERYKSGTQLISLLIEAKSKGGSLLLNTGPKPDGSLDPAQEDRLREMAAWYFINHECVDSVKTWVINKEHNIYYTTRENKALYAIITEVEDWKEGERREFILASVKAAANTTISVLGQNSKVIEYNKVADVGCKYRQAKEGLVISVVKAQRIYDDHRWPNPVVVKLENVVPAFSDAVSVVTSKATGNKKEIELHGKLVNFGNKNIKQALFAYRPYKGQVETLYAGKWIKTLPVIIDKNGNFKTAIKNLKGSIEYKAVAQQQGVEIEGDIITKP